MTFSSAGLVSPSGKINTGLTTCHTCYQKPQCWCWSYHIKSLSSLIHSDSCLIACLSLIHQYSYHMSSLSSALVFASYISAGLTTCLVFCPCLSLIHQCWSYHIFALHIRLSSLSSALVSPSYISTGLTTCLSLLPLSLPHTALSALVLVLPHVFALFCPCLSLIHQYWSYHMSSLSSALVSPSYISTGLTTCLRSLLPLSLPHTSVLVLPHVFALFCPCLSLIHQYWSYHMSSLSSALVSPSYISAGLTTCLRSLLPLSLPHTSVLVLPHVFALFCPCLCLIHQCWSYHMSSLSSALVSPSYISAGLTTCLRSLLPLSLPHTSVLVLPHVFALFCPCLSLIHQCWSYHMSSLSSALVSPSYISTGLTTCLRSLLPLSLPHTSVLVLPHVFALFCPCLSLIHQCWSYHMSSLSSALVSPSYISAGLTTCLRSLLPLSLPHTSVLVLPHVFTLFCPCLCLIHQCWSYHMSSLSSALVSASYISAGLTTCLRSLLPLSLPHTSVLVLPHVFALFCPCLCLIHQCWSYHMSSLSSALVSPSYISTGLTTCLRSLLPLSLPHTSVLVLPHVFALFCPCLSLIHQYWSYHMSSLSSALVSASYISTGLTTCLRSLLPLSLPHTSVLVLPHVFALFCPCLCLIHQCWSYHMSSLSSALVSPSYISAGLTTCLRSLLPLSLPHTSVLVLPHVFALFCPCLCLIHQCWSYHMSSLSSALVSPSYISAGLTTCLRSLLPLSLPHTPVLVLPHVFALFCPCLCLIHQCWSYHMSSLSSALVSPSYISAGLTTCLRSLLPLSLPHTSVLVLPHVFALFCPCLSLIHQCWSYHMSSLSSALVFASYISAGSTTVLYTRSAVHPSLDLHIQFSVT